MAVEFLSDDEALKIAMSVEKQGMEFYRNLSQAVDNADTRKLLVWLSEEEKRHFQIFKEADEKLLTGPISHPPQIDEEIANYLRSLIDTGIFSGLSEFSIDEVRRMDEVRVLNIGIRVEKDSILFYSEALNHSVNPSGKKAFGEILTEEKKHLVSLTNRLREVKRTK